jgi:amino acid adenylation domain-containing protein/FkbM family methyltransferase
MNDDQLAPEQQAYLAERLGGRAKNRARCPIPRRSYSGPAPLSFVQEGIWFASQLAPEMAVYNIAFTVFLPWSVTREAVLGALSELARRHEILRTEFPALDGVPMQRVRAVPEVDLSDLGALEGQDAAHHLQRMVAQPFSLAAAPLWRGGLFRARHRLHLFIVIHHLIADGWSLAEMSRQILRLCIAPARNEPLDREHAPPQYADFAVWQRQRLEAGELERHLQYWRGKLAGVPTLCTFPADRPRAAVASFKGETCFFTLGEEVASRLRSLARREEASLFMVLLAAFKVLLSRYTGQTDVTVGTPFACRPLPVLERMLGCFVNIMPLRTMLAADCSFRDLVGRVKQTVLEAHVHQQYPFNRIVEALRPERDLTANPLFQTAFSLEEQEQAAAPEFEVYSEAAASSGTSKFDFTLVLSRGGDALIGAVEYNTDLFSAALVAHVLEHYRTLLASVAGDPYAPIGGVEVFSAAQKALIERRNATDTPLDAGSLLGLVFARMTHPPDGVAVSAGDRQMTYGQLLAASRNVAQGLAELGAEPGDLIGLGVGASIELLPCVLGTLAAGCAYVPLDPGYPAERLAFMIADAGTRIVVAAPEAAGKLQAASVLVTAARELTAPPPSPRREHGGPREGELAYVIYTSGSTGHPKGARVGSRGLANLVQWYVAALALRPDDRLLVMSSFSFDLTQKDLLAPLSVGAQVVFLPAEFFEPLEFAREIERRRITVVNCTPSVCYALLDALGGDYRPLRSLRWLVLGGEPIAAERLRDWLDSPHCQARILNTYGPTECSDVAAAFELRTAGPEPLAEPIPIGRPIWNAQLAVVDDGDRLAPLGAVGELWIAGMGVGQGYHQRQDLTAARFVLRRLDPFPATRWYRTGDLVRYDGDGDLVFVGRADQQIKLRGFRVELEEIENVLARAPHVAGAVVLADGAGESTTIRAFVVPANDAPRSLHNALALQAAGAWDGRLIELPNGMPVVAPNRPEMEFLYREIWAEETYFRHGIALGDGGCVFDVGANAGLFTLHAACRARQLAIYAFEPIPPLLEMLRQNLALHEVEAQCFGCGLSAQSGSAEFTYYPHVSIISGMHGSAEEDRETMRRFLRHSFAEQGAAIDERDLEELVADRLAAERFGCRLRTLSEVVDEAGVERIDLLKVDVEKSELEVLAGIEPRHWPLVQQAVLEVHDRDGSLGRVMAVLQENGLLVVCEQASRLSQTGLYNVYARRPGYAAPRATRRPAPGDAPASPGRLEASVMAFAAARLPGYMMPSSIVVVQRFPTTASGKVDRRALAATPLAKRAAWVAPRTTVEEELASLWREVLGVERVGVEDNFFEIGGHSLKAAQLAARVREEFAIDFAVPNVFQHARLSALAAHVTAEILREMPGTGPQPLARGNESSLE